MYQFEITTNEAGQRFDKYLHKLLPLAPASFFYKMLRKKNIVLNGKKAEGKEKLNEGDTVKLFLSEETFQSFSVSKVRTEAVTDSYLKAFRELNGIRVIYENNHMVILHKPAGVLSQKAKDNDISVNEWLIGYLLHTNKITENTLSTYKPSVCNRLDRNTSGLVICACSLAGSQEVTRLIVGRDIRKFYRLFVKDHIYEEGIIEGYLQKNSNTNRVNILNKSDLVSQHLSVNDYSYIKTKYSPIENLSDMTYLEIELITGKTHQIRAHMASIGHPLLGDYKYGNRNFNDTYKSKYNITSQLLHAYRLEIPQNKLLTPDGPIVITDEEPSIYNKLLKRD